MPSTPRPLHANSLRYRSTRMSSAPSDLTAATRKRYKPATYGTLFTKEDVAFWHGVDRSREDITPQGSLSQEAEQAHNMLPATERAAKRYTPFSTDLGENCILKHS